jgi:UDP-N-acetylglucosamine--N-acetylmuramyl-(pentapeptide) pyrophosphoryl-undecaprenol N-acetylglucosamine transferase
MSRKVFIAGGGTGGHIYPGVAIARALQKQESDLDVHFVGSSTGLETKIIPREGFPLHLIAGGKLNLSGQWLTKIKTLVKIPWGLLQSFRILRKHKPDFVLGVGGYASGPFVLAAALLRVPCAIWEPNAQPGLANRWLSRFVDVCYVVFAGTEKWLRHEHILVFGMPVRADIEQAVRGPRQDQKFHLLSFGGSQGSRVISTALSTALLEDFRKSESQNKWTADLAVVHQLGSTDFQRFQKDYSGCESVVTPLEFIYDMPKYYDWADLVVARGGASTIMEIAAFGLPSIIIPLPLADNHQGKNAESLVRAGGGRMILQSELTRQRLAQEIQELRQDPKRLQQMGLAAKKLFKPQAAGAIAADLLRRSRPAKAST